MPKINEHDLAVTISKMEGKKIEVNIGQIKEILNLTLEILSSHKASEVMELIERQRQQR